MISLSLIGKIKGMFVSLALVPDLVEVVNKHGKAKLNPNVVQNYNEHMSGIDRSNQMLSYNSDGTKKWPFTSWKFFSVILIICTLRIHKLLL